MEISELSLPEMQELETHAMRDCSSLVTKDEVMRLTDRIGNVCQESGYDNATVLVALKVVIYSILKVVLKAHNNEERTN